MVPREPTVWASLPEWMSFSTIQWIEACPRYWALMSSDYPDIWSKHGYPVPLIQSTLIGKVIHRLVEIILKEFQISGCTSFDDSSSIDVMRKLGGFSRIIEKITDDVLIEYSNNPRSVGKLNVVKKILMDRKSDIRENTRILLSRIFEGKQIATKCFSSVSQGSTLALRNGVFSEVLLVNEEIKWKGVADFIKLTQDECEIRDFKTGKPKQKHIEQLKIYSFLWLYDKQKNPSARPASKLTISYIDADIDVPPLSVSEANVYKDQLIERTRQAKIKITDCPPEANIEEENCCHCFVRHLCTNYWESGLQKIGKKEKPDNSLIDIAVKIVGVHGSRSYDAVTIASTNIPQNTPIILRVTEKFNFIRGTCLRLLNMRINRVDADESNGQLIVNSSKISEIYLMPNS